MKKLLFLLLVLILTLSPVFVFSEDVSVIKSSDPDGVVTVNVKKVLLGWNAVRLGYYYDHQLDQVIGYRKKLIYFEVAVTNNLYPKNITVSSSKFKLIDTKGNLYPNLQSRDFISYEPLAFQRTITGGVGFAVYTDETPDLLEFDTGLVKVKTGNPLIVQVKNLSKLDIFKK
jgi:hypothetical protein